MQRIAQIGTRIFIDVVALICLGDDAAILCGVSDECVAEGIGRGDAPICVDGEPDSDEAAHA